MGAVKLSLMIALLLVVAVTYNWSTLDNLIIALVALVFVSWVWSRDSLNRLGLRRSLTSDRVRVGDVIEEELQLTNHSRVPRLWIEVQDHSTLPGHHAGAVASIRGRSSFSWKTQTRVVRRGTFQLGPFTVHGGDPFGIFEKKRLIPVSHDLVVYPAAIDVSGVPLPVASMSGGLMRHGTLAVSSPTIAGIRQYAPGDPLNRISWSATARRGAMMVKEFDPDPTADLWLVLDLAERGQYDLDAPVGAAASAPGQEARLDTTVEYIVAIGGSLAERALSDGRKVGLVVNRAMPLRLDADNSERQWFRIFEVLASVDAFGERSLAEALTADSRRFSRTNGVIVITSDPETDWVAAAQALVQRQVAVTAVVVDAGGSGADDVGPLIQGLAGAHVNVHRFPTHTASTTKDAPHFAVGT